MTEIEVPVEDLMNTTSPAATHKALPATHIPTTTTTPRGSAFRGTNEYEHGDPGAEETWYPVTSRFEIDTKLEISPRGATLEINIPCIISSKRKRFQAFARYIGEVEGEYGPWVGVEVPVGESWVGDKLEGRQWNDGTWGGVRYFDIGAAGSEWDDGDNDRAVRRRKLDIMNGSVKGLKREGDQLNVDRAKRLRSASPATSDLSNSESRGLFVRPQKVLYVVDAIGTDLWLVCFLFVFFLFASEKNKGKDICIPRYNMVAFSFFFWIFSSWLDI